MAPSALLLCLATLLAVSQAATRNANTCKFNVGYDFALVADQARALSSHSWEYGTAAEAFLELYDPSLSVFGTDPFPGGRVPCVDWMGVNALSYAKQFILTNNETLIDGDGKLILKTIFVRQ
jgi:hypothetical protein